MNAISQSFDMIDWARLAEPQADQYDTDITLQLASSTTSAARPQLYTRTPVGDAPAIFDGQVAIRHAYRSWPEFELLLSQYHLLDAPTDHSNIGIAAEYVRSWPLGFQQCQRLLDTIHPVLDRRIPLESPEVYRGSLCHSYEHMFGTMWATIFCPIGLAEAIVHEMAHQKLRALGVSFESATTIVGNDPSELYVSPVIKERPRPMTAVLHAEYSYVYVTTLDTRMLVAEEDPHRRAVLDHVLRTNLARIEEGNDTIRNHFRAGPYGPEFMAGFYEWIESTISSARAALNAG